jgi:hypothetical protein
LTSILIARIAGDAGADQDQAEALDFLLESVSSTDVAFRRTLMSIRLSLVFGFAVAAPPLCANPGDDGGQCSLSAMRAIVR